MAFLVFSNQGSWPLNRLFVLTDCKDLDSATDKVVSMLAPKEKIEHVSASFMNNPVVDDGKLVRMVSVVISEQQEMPVFCVQEVPTVDAGDQD